MNIKTWNHKPIQTWSLLHVLNENKKGCCKACMVTYQIGDWIKAGVPLGEGSVGFGPLSFFQADQSVSSLSSKQMSVSISFLDHKLFLFSAYLVELQSCAFVVCVALKLCSRFLQTWIFFWMFLKVLYISF